MLKKILFQTHWLLGITVGIVLAIIGLTGAILSFQDELVAWLNSDIVQVVPKSAEPLTPAELIAQLKTQAPAKRVTTLTLSSHPGEVARVVLVTESEGLSARSAVAKRGETNYVDPYDGKLLGQPRGEEFFRTTREIHRRLIAGDVGKQIVGASTIGLIILSLAGLYLRWPRLMRGWHAWINIRWKHTGRGFLRDLHVVTGIWVLLPYLLLAVTGLYWSYDWYRDALFSVTGTPKPVQQNSAREETTRRGMPRSNTPDIIQTPNVATAWTTFQQTVTSYRSVTLRLPERPQQPVQISYLDADSPHDRASNRISIHSLNGTVLLHERYADKSVGAKFMASIFALHSGRFFGMPGVIFMMIASALMPLFAVTGWMLYLDRRAKKKMSRNSLNDFERGGRSAEVTNY
ncbi:MAG: PepSY-associated TM helix domain-containing protein [Pseudomonadota bacterium]